MTTVHFAALLAFHRAFNASEARIARRLRDANMTLPECQVLLSLLTCPPGQVLMAVVEAQAGLSEHGFDKALKAIEGRGFVSRARKEGNARVVLLTLTDRGIEWAGPLATDLREAVLETVAPLVRAARDVVQLKVDPTPPPPTDPDMWRPQGRAPA